MIAKIYLILTLLIALVQHIDTQVPQIFINYGVDNEGLQLFKFFYDVNDGFYVDIGAYDSIFASNTLNLQAMGWDGINIDASPERLARFFQTRPWENSLNYAIGDQDKFVTLYQLSQDSSSTISVNVKELVKGSKPVVQQILIPSLTMKQLCERFFYRRPLFINLDIEGYGPKALLTNDWSNIKCVPQIFFSQINEQTIASGFQPPESILKKHGYRKWKTNVGLNEIFILQTEYDKYVKKYTEGSKLLQLRSVYPLSYLANGLSAKMNLLPTNFVPHYDPKIQSIYYHFARNKQIVDIEKISKFSNSISSTIKDRPIVICNFNPQNSYIALKNKNYSVQNYMLGASKFYNITVWRDAQQNYSVYILDQFLKPQTNPRIIITQSTQYEVQIQVKHNQTLKQMIEHPNETTTPTNTKILKQVYNLLNQTILITNKTNNNIESRIRQLSMTLLTNHHYDKAQFQKILNQITKLQQTIQNKKQSSKLKQYQSDMSNIQDIVVSAIRFEVGVLIAVLVVLVIVNVIICVTQEQSIYLIAQSVNNGAVQNNSSQNSIQSPNANERKISKSTKRKSTKKSSKKNRKNKEDQQSSDQDSD